jgi:mRNA interferase HigB
LRTIIEWQADNRRESPVRIISKSRLVQYWESPDCEDSEGPLRAWYTHVSSKSVGWNHWTDLKADFASASHVGNCVVFNIGGNKVRLIARVLYPSHKVFVLKVMAHREYDDGKWKEECGCHEPPPDKTKTARKKKVMKKKSRRKGKGR